MLIVLEILYILLLSACSVGAYKTNNCKLNDDTEYLCTQSLLELKLPKDLDVKLSISGGDYSIPDFTDTNAQKMGKELNICPPLVLSENILRESCLINIED